MEKRINPLTNKEEGKIAPPGRPEIWVTLNEYCDRCAKFKECLRFDLLTKEEWEEVDNIISETNLMPVILTQVKEKYGKDNNTIKCAS